ncbi:MAG: amidohydrolase [Akkermansiaceae bacterium]|nr:amidohydrolase [Akkermansiaceae bacterium]MCP5550645.1 amidohydrolase [Akkermansiaceae bacterium]
MIARSFWFLLVTTTLAAAAAGQSPSGKVETHPSPEHREAVAGWLDRHVAEVVAVYKHFHANPELSLQELKTATTIARGLEKAGYEVTQGVGQTGVVAVLKNGDGPTLLIRGDMDGLPVIEETGVDYASQVRVKKPDGTTVGAMHACGHDVHSSMLLGVGPLLSDLKTQWKGTLVLVAQPAEEVGKGARMMIADGLFERFPKPDYCLSLHVKHDLPAGAIGYTSGYAFANVDSVDITIHGKGGHGARPNDTVDPIVTAAHVITALQTIVSRRVNPVEPAVVTVGSIHGGTKHNIIPDEVKLQLTVRSYSDAVRRRLLDGIRQITVDTCRTFGCPREPEVRVDKEEYTPAAYNDPALTAAAVSLFGTLIGPENVKELAAEMGGEDFGRFAKHLGVPGLQYRVGGVSLDRYAAAQQPGAGPLPSLHSALFYPDPDPTVRLAVESMANLALSLLAKP